MVMKKPERTGANSDLGESLQPNIRGVGNGQENDLRERLQEGRTGKCK